MSVAPPGANGTMSVIGRVGNCSCCATASTAGMSMASTAGMTLPTNFAFMTPLLSPSQRAHAKPPRAWISLALSVPIRWRNPISRGPYCSQNAPRSERRLVDFGTDRAKGITNCVGDRGGRRDSAALAHPLHAVFGERRRSFRVGHFDLGHLCRARHEIIRKRAHERLPLLVIRYFLVQRRADTLDHAAPYLPFHDHRIDHGSTVFCDAVVEDLDRAGTHVDGDDRGMCREAKHAGVDRGLVRAGDREQWLDTLG